MSKSLLIKTRCFCQNVCPKQIFKYGFLFLGILSIICQSQGIVFNYLDCPGPLYRPFLCRSVIVLTYFIGKMDPRAPIQHSNFFLKRADDIVFQPVSSKRIFLLPPEASLLQRKRMARLY